MKGSKSAQETSRCLLDRTRLEIGRRRGEEFLELILNDDVKGMKSFSSRHLGNRDLRNYGLISQAFNGVVGKGLAHEYTIHFEELTSDRIRGFYKTLAHDSSNNACLIPFGVKRETLKHLRNHYGM